MVSPTGDTCEDKVLVWRILSDSSTQILFISQIGSSGLQADGCREIKKVLSRHDSARGRGQAFYGLPDCVDFYCRQICCAVVWLENDAACCGRVLCECDSQTRDARE